MAMIVLASPDGVVADWCQESCDELTSCSKGSYCKHWQDVTVCYGMYYTSAGADQTICYHPDDPSCPETNPLTCVVTTETVSSILITEPEIPTSNSTDIMPSSPEANQTNAVNSTVIEPRGMTNETMNTSSSVLAQL